MNAQVPAIVAAGGGSMLLAAIAAHEQLSLQAMRASRQTFELTFPTGVSEPAVNAALSSLAGLDTRSELVLEVAADEIGVTHLLHVPLIESAAVIGGLAAAMPGLRVSPVDRTTSGTVDVALRVTVGSRALLRTDDFETAGRTLLAPLGALNEGERVSLRWAIRPGVIAPEVRLPRLTEHSALSIRAERRALQARAGSQGFDVRGLVLVRGRSMYRARQLASTITTAIRGRRGVGRGLSVRRGRALGAGVLPRAGRGQNWLSPAELAGLIGFPIGDVAIEGVQVGVSRQLRTARSVERSGRRLFTGFDARGERPVALSDQAAMHHLLVIGPSGVGKSVLLARGVLDQIASGGGGILVDPKGGDLANLVLDGVPKAHADRIVVLDPAEASVPGLRLLQGGDPDLDADVVTGVLARIFQSAWGVRSDFYVRLAVRTVADVPGATLADAGRLLIDAPYRRQALAHVADEFTRSAWQGFEQLGTAEQAQHVQAPVSRLLGLLSRPKVRAVLASPAPKLDIARALEDRKFIIVSLSPGVLGEAATRLIASVVMYATWSAIEARSALPAAKRHPIWVTIDELATLADLPISFELLAERARGLGAGLTVATQTLGRLPESLRASLLGNVGSLISFRAGRQEAARLAAELPGLEAGDLMSLGRFEVAARVATGIGSAGAVLTGHTDPLGDPVGLAGEIRKRSAERYGASPEEPRAARPDTFAKAGKGHRFGRSEDRV